MKARDVFAVTGHSGMRRILMMIGVLVALVLPAAAAAEAPSVTIAPVGSHSIVTAHVSGTVDAHGIGTSWTFETSTDGVTWQPTNVSSITESTGPETVEGVIEGLTAGTTYEVRLSAFNFEEFVSYYSPQTPEFTTDPAVAPTLALDPPGEIGYTTAKLSGTIDPEGGNTDADAGLLPIPWEVQYAPASSPGSWQPAGSISPNPLEGSAAENSSAVEAEATGLAAGTEYLYRLVAHYAGLTAVSPTEGSFETDPAAKPIVSGLTATETSLSGFVNPNAPGPAPQDPAFDTHWEFICSPSCNFFGDSSGDIAAGDSATEVTATPTGLLPNQTYDVTLRAHNAGGTEELSTTFSTEAIKPDLAQISLTEPTQTSIILNELVNPHNNPLTDCHFVYGIGGMFNQSAPCEGTLPSGGGFSQVSAAISGLTPGAEYTFKLIATNSAGTAEGEPRSFHALEEAPEEACPNEAIREQQFAAHLPDCRAFEQVSPAEKGGGDISGEGFTVIASKDGDGAVYASRTPFGDTIGSGAVGSTQYLARRGNTAWITHAITPTGRPEAIQTLTSATRLGPYSDDLTTALIAGYDLPAVADDTPGRNNMYVEDTATRALRTVTASETGIVYPYAEFIDPQVYWGLSADAKHVAFVSPTQFLPEAAPDVPNAYLWDDGVLSVAGVMPNGSIPSGGSTLDPESIRSIVSADGSSVAFSSPADNSAPPQLYLRIDGEETVRISEPEGSNQVEPVGVVFQGMTPDGSNVFFVSDTPLLDEDTASGPDLYRYTVGPDPNKEANLTLISHEGSAVSDIYSGTALIGMSDDGERVYYHTITDNLKVWDHGETRLIATGLSRSPVFVSQLTLQGRIPGLGRVSADGNWFAYMAGGMYLYDLEDDTRTCVSCSATASEGGVTVEAKVTNGTAVVTPGARPRFLSDNGQVFFSTPRRLLPGDINGVADTYAYDGRSRALSLLTSGKGSEPSMFADASADGDDVFFLTRQRLWAGDSDDYVDLYDARADGGMPAPPSDGEHPCQAEDCQPPSTPAPAPEAIGTAAVTGRGNVKVQRHKRCARRARHGDKRRKCSRRKHASHRRTANQTGRAGK